MMRSVQILCALLAAALAGCAGGPPPELMVPKAEDANFGYTEKQLSDKSYEITYYGPEIYTELTVKVWLDQIVDAAKQTSRDLALWRAAQLASAKGHKAFVVTGESGLVQHYIVGRDYENVPVAPFTNTTIRRLEYWSATYFRGQAKLTVEFADERPEGGYDAAATADTMKARYADIANMPIMADARYYFGPASWLYGYKEGYEEAPVFESEKGPPRPPAQKPLGQPYYMP